MQFQLCNAAATGGHPPVGSLQMCPCQILSVHCKSTVSRCSLSNKTWGHIARSSCPVENSLCTRCWQGLRASDCDAITPPSPSSSEHEARSTRGLCLRKQSDVARESQSDVWRRDGSTLFQLAMNSDQLRPLFLFTQRFAMMFGFCIFLFWFSYFLGSFEIGFKWHIQGGRDRNRGRTRVSHIDHSWQLELCIALSPPPFQSLFCRCWS